jgi:acyl-[acyl-carrier-protein]-phospholipid O-acyltransferase/long-chain-fatty-acid--[acyl-carrier-protein] ligase
MLMGVPMACSPEPRNAKSVGRTVARYEASILFSIPSLFRLYTQSALVHPLMFQSLRVAIAGGEKLDPDEQDAFEKKFKKVLFEGYGVTESAPLASINIPDIMESKEFTVQKGQKRGSVGMPLPGTAFRIVDPQTLETLGYDEEGLVLIGGAQVMKGYLKDPEQTSRVIVELDGLRWFKTGDRGTIDADGFLTISGRYYPNRQIQ